MCDIPEFPVMGMKVMDATGHRREKIFKQVFITFKINKNEFSTPFLVFKNLLQTTRNREFGVSRSNHKQTKEAEIDHK